MFFLKKYLHSVKSICIIPFAVTLIAMKREVAATAGISVERMSGQDTDGKSL